MARKPKAHPEGDDSSFTETAEALQEPIEQAFSPPPAPPPAGVRVMLLCRDVFLPENLLADNWASSQTTKEYFGENPETGRRTKLEVHPTLADFLQGRKQAEILD